MSPCVDVKDLNFSSIARRIWARHRTGKDNAFGHLGRGRNDREVQQEDMKTALIFEGGKDGICVFALPKLIVSEALKIRRCLSPLHMSYHKKAFSLTSGG